MTIINSYIREPDIFLGMKKNHVSIWKLTFMSDLLWNLNGFSTISHVLCLCCQCRRFYEWFRTGTFLGPLWESRSVRFMFSNNEASVIRSMLCFLVWFPNFSSERWITPKTIGLLNVSFVSVNTTRHYLLF